MRASGAPKPILIGEKVYEFQEGASPNQYVLEARIAPGDRLVERDLSEAPECNDPESGSMSERDCLAFADPIPQASAQRAAPKFSSGGTSRTSSPSAIPQSSHFAPERS